MMIVIGLMLAGQVAAAQPAPEAKKPARAKLICVDSPQLGTRLGGQRICRTKAEWDQDRNDMRHDIENAQRTNYH